MTKAQSNQFRILLNEARIAGIEAVQKLVSSGKIVPMVVQEHVNPLDDNSPVGRQWFVGDGACGFAWIKVITRRARPTDKDYNATLNTQFANWLKAQAKTQGRRNDEIMLPDKTAYNGGVDIWVSGFDQSVQKKETYAAAFAGVLQKAGIRAYSHSRLD
jgi:hypothetical protein